MSGIYITGIEMPKDKAIAVVIHPDGTAYSAEMFAGVCTEYLADCTAVPVPDHGRCVDADKLKAIVADERHMDASVHQGRLLYSDHLCVGADYEDVCKAIDETPTILPGEEASE